MDSIRLEQLLADVRPLALQAGAAIRAVSLDDVDQRDKADGSPLTRADTASHNVIVSGLTGITPDIPIISEEGDLSLTGTWDFYWCIDPLDGTKEFIQGSGDYTVNIALVENGIPILGVIYVPAQDVTYAAASGQAWRQRGNEDIEPIAAGETVLPRTAVVSRSHLSSETEAMLTMLGISEFEKRGSSLKICAVAEGNADLYPRLGPTCLWDTAAGTAIARQAGCAVVDLGGAPLLFQPAQGLKQAGFLVYPESADAARILAAVPDQSDPSDRSD